MKPSTVKYITLFTSILTLILGGIIVANVLDATVVINYILLIALGIIGISRICSFVASAKGEHSAWDLVLGILFLMVALTLLSNPNLIENATIIGYVFAAMAIISGIGHFVTAYQIRKAHPKMPIGWEIFSGVIAILLAICLIMLPIFTQVAFIYIIGIFLIVSSIVSFISGLFIKTGKK